MTNPDGLGMPVIWTPITMHVFYESIRSDLPQIAQPV